MPKVVAIIQARMGSTRLPGKVMMPMAGKPMLQRVIERVQRSKLVDSVIVAVPADEHYKELNLACMAQGACCQCVTCDSDDVLGRFAEVARRADADVIVRICGDSPMTRPENIDAIVRAVTHYPAGYAGFMLQNRRQAIDTKRGIYAEAFTMPALRYCDSVASDAFREHVTTMMREDDREMHDDYNANYLAVVHDDGIDRAVDTQEDFDRVEAMILEEEATNETNHVCEWEVCRTG